jgi:hypothetical protein
MIDLLKRLVIFLLVLLLLTGVAEHLFFSGITAAHVSQEANCPIHSGIVPLERAQTLVVTAVIRIGEVHDNTHSFNLSTKISHPPTV